MFWNSEGEKAACGMWREVCQTRGLDIWTSKEALRPQQPSLMEAPKFGHLFPPGKRIPKIGVSGDGRNAFECFRALGARRESNTLLVCRPDCRPEQHQLVWLVRMDAQSLGLVHGCHQWKHADPKWELERRTAQSWFQDEDLRLLRGRRRGERDIDFNHSQISIVFVRSLLFFGP